jgi:mRNA interferase MazF
MVSADAPGWAEIWWCDFDEAGRRPVVVLTRPEAVGRLPRLLVAPATTRVRNLPSEVPLDVDDGVPKPCVLNLDTPELVERHRLTERIGRLSAQRWHDVCNALAAAVNC